MKSQNNRNSSRQPVLSTQESIQQRAYDVYMKRGQEPGHELEDWLLAEEQIREEQEHSVNQPAQR